MKIRTSRYEIKGKSVPRELSGLRIALFSDTHNKYYGPGGELIVSLLEAEQPDIVIFAGDGVKKSARNTDPVKGTENAAELFTAVAARFPLYYVNGNHERRWQKRSRNLPYYSGYVRQLKAAGVHYLRNETAAAAGGRLRITGLDLPPKYYKMRRGRLPHLASFIGRSSDEAFDLLIAHTPAYFPDYAAWGADLTLSGHIHGGIIRLPFVGGLVSPHRRFFPKYDYGLYELDGHSMIVSSGAGDHKPRLTFNNPYEIVIITLIHEEAGDGA